MARLICGEKGSVLFCDSGETIVKENGEEKKPTNADRIRSMSIEELAEFLYTVAAFGIKRQYEGVPCDSCYERNECAKCWKEWLELETEEGEFLKKVFFP